MPDLNTCHVIFAFNRPDYLTQVLDALRPQEVDNLLVFVDGPRNDAEAKLTTSCTDLARSVKWCRTDVIDRESNTGLGGILDSISGTFERFERAIFIEDDCLPMLGFTNYMLAGLDYYEKSKDVFSIAGYQPIRKGVFQKWPYAAIPSYRFQCWGWASWRDRWEELRPLLPEFWRFFNRLEDVPAQAIGSDIPPAARACARGETDTWDVRVAIATLFAGKRHIHPVQGLVRNLDRKSTRLNSSHT